LERTRKTWGEKFNIFQNDLCEVSVLYLEPEKRCSWHSHKTKYNQFFVIEGELFIKLTDGLSRVGRNEIFTTRPGEMHEFQTQSSPAVVIEIMYVEYDAEDIDREEIGGDLPMFRARELN